MLTFISTIFSLDILSNFTEHETKEVLRDGTGGGSSHIDFVSFVVTISVSSDIFSKLSALASEVLGEEAQIEGTGEGC